MQKINKNIDDKNFITAKLTKKFNNLTISQNIFFFLGL